MTTEFIARIVGMILLSLAGLQLGVLLADLAGVPNESRVPYVMVITLVGALAGLILTPWLTTRPFTVLRKRIRQVPASQLISAVVGLVIGLIIAV